MILMWASGSFSAIAALLDEIRATARLWARGGAHIGSLTVGYGTAKCASYRLDCHISSIGFFRRGNSSVQPEAEGAKTSSIVCVSLIESVRSIVCTHGSGIRLYWSRCESTGSLVSFGKTGVSLVVCGPPR